VSIVERLIEELPDVRLAIVNAVLAEVAKKGDLEWLEEELENRINNIDVRLARVEGQLSLFVKLFVAFNLHILMAVIGILLRIVF